MKKFEDRIRVYLEERGWAKLHPADLAKSIIIEGAELLEHFQWENKSSDEIRVDVEKMDGIKKELADLMIYCFDMAVVLDIDVEKMLNEKLDKVIEKYPAKIGTEEAYWEIKNQYRTEGKN